MNAKHLLLLHSMQGPGDNPIVDSGFLGRLRPYTGLREENYTEVCQAIIAVAPLFRENQVDREILNALWAICYYARAWGLEPNGMLRRNNLISDSNVSKLEKWVKAINKACMILLEGHFEIEKLNSCFFDLEP